MAGAGSDALSENGSQRERIRTRKSAITSSQATLNDVMLALKETQEERTLRIRALFDFFDTKHKGCLEHSDIEEGFKALSIPIQYKYAKELLKVCDSNQDGSVDFDEFHDYMDDKELELYIIFSEIDYSNNESIEPHELKAALKRAGINVSDAELAKFVDRIDKDNSGAISFEEWRDFLLLYPHTVTIENIYQYWEKVCLVDIGENAVIPEGISRHLHATKYFIAGGVAGALSRTATAPFDRTKVLMQIGREKSSVIPCMLKIYKDNGILGFFRGNGLNIVKVTPESAIKFYAYETVKDIFTRFGGIENRDDLSGIGRLFAGGTAGAIAQTAIYPMDLLKTRLQTYVSTAGKSPTLYRLSKDIWVQEGPRAFYRGLLPSLLGVIPYAGIDLATYESLKQKSREWLPESQEPGAILQLCCGMISGTVGATCVYPLQLVRTRLQAQRTNSKVRYKGMLDVFQRTWREEGLFGFYKGLYPSLLKVVPAASITYVAYEEMKTRLSI